MRAWSAAQEAASKEDEAAKEEAARREAEKNLPLYQQRPHEELHLRDGRDRDGNEKVAIIKIRPLGPPHLINDELPKSILVVIQVRLVDRDEIYTLQRGKILKWLRFHDLILREAERLVEEGKTEPKKFDEAFYYYQHLRANYRDKLPTLNVSTARFHLEEAKSYLPAGRHAQALALLNLAFELQADLPGLADAMASAIQGLIDGYLRQQKFAPARALLAGFQQKFPAHASGAKWQGQLSAEAQKLLDQAKQQLAGKDLHEARELALRSVSIWPLDEARNLLNDAQRRSPRIVVGVMQPAAAPNPQRLDDWAARRSGRLLHRMLLEFTGYAALGGQYRCPLGLDPRHEALGRQLVLQLNPKIAWSDGAGPLTAADVCRHLMALADAGDPSYRADWAELFVAARVRNEVEVVIDLRRSHVHPDGVLQTVVRPWYQRGKETAPATVGPFVVHQAVGGEVRYRANPRYFAAGAAQPTGDRRAPLSRRPDSPVRAARRPDRRAGSGEPLGRGPLAGNSLLGRAALRGADGALPDSPSGPQAAGAADVSPLPGVGHPPPADSGRAAQGFAAGGQSVDQRAFPGRREQERSPRLRLRRQPRAPAV